MLLYSSEIWTICGQAGSEAKHPDWQLDRLLSFLLLLQEQRVVKNKNGWRHPESSVSPKSNVAKALALSDEYIYEKRTKIYH